MRQVLACDVGVGMVMMMMMMMISIYHARHVSLSGSVSADVTM